MRVRDDMTAVAMVRLLELHPDEYVRAREDAMAVIEALAEAGFIREDDRPAVLR